MSAFFQWHVGCCRRANTSLMGFVSAWRCYADEHCLFFPARDSRELMRLRQTIKGAQLRYPHEPRRDLPLTLDLLDIVADGLGIRCLNDYNHCKKSTLSFMCRLLVAHQACMRTTEHAGGCTRSDAAEHTADDGSKFMVFRVGARTCDRKIKRRQARFAVLPCADHHLSAGAVLRVFLRLCHHGTRPDGVLFVAYDNGRQTRRAAPWSRDLRLLRRLLAGAPALAASASLNIGRSSLRAGGATDWFACGATREWVALQGGWRSDAIDIYNRPTPSSRLHQVATLALGNAHRHQQPRARRRRQTSRSRHRY